MYLGHCPAVVEATDYYISTGATEYGGSLHGREKRHYNIVK